MNDTLPIVPVVVIKGKNQWIEWKRFVCLFDNNGYRKYIGISLNFMNQTKMED